MAMQQVRSYRKKRLGHGSNSNQAKLKTRHDAGDKNVGRCPCGRYIVVAYPDPRIGWKKVDKCRLCSFKRPPVRDDLREFMVEIAPALRGCEAVCTGKHAAYIRDLAKRAEDLAVKYNCNTANSPAPDSLPR